MVNEELRRGHDARPSASGSRGEWGLPPTTADVVNHGEGRLHRRAPNAGER
jgi:hypothetical protein